MCIRDRCSRLGSKYGDRKVVTGAVNMLFFISLLHVFMMVGGVITPSDPLERPENWGMRESRFAEMMAIESTGSKITGLKFYRQLAPPSTVINYHLCVEIKFKARVHYSLSYSYAYDICILHDSKYQSWKKNDTILNLICLFSYAHLAM